MDCRDVRRKVREEPIDITHLLALASLPGEGDPDLTRL